MSMSKEELLAELAAENSVLQIQQLQLNVKKLHLRMFELDEEKEMTLERIEEYEQKIADLQAPPVEETEE